MNDTRPYTQRDIAAQAERTRRLAEIRRMTRDREARLNRGAFSPEPGLSVDQMLEMFEPDLAAQERTDKAANDEVADAIAEPVEPYMAELLGLDSGD